MVPHASTALDDKSRTLIYYSQSCYFSHNADENRHSCNEAPDSTPITMMDKSFAEWKKMKEPHSVMLDPLFKDVKNDDYTLVSRKNIRKIGFKPFNYSEAGVYGDKEWRKKALLSLQKLELFKKMASIRLQK